MGDGGIGAWASLPDSEFCNSSIRGVRSLNVSGTKKNTAKKQTAPTIAISLRSFVKSYLACEGGSSYQNTHCQLRPCTTAAETRGTRFFPPRRSKV